MPTVNIYYEDKDKRQNLQKLASNLKNYLAEKLSCGDIKLTPNEISIRLVNVGSASMIGVVEIEITAHAFAERVKKQDDICRDLRTYVLKEFPKLGEVRAWLILCELGHSW